MHIDLAKQYIVELVRALPTLFEGVTVKYEFGKDRPFIGNDSLADFRGMLGGHDIAFKSGLYFFLLKIMKLFILAKLQKTTYML